MRNITHHIRVVGGIDFNNLTGFVNEPRSDGVAFTVVSFARYFLHDPVHHLDDVRRGNEILAAGSLDT